MQQIIVSDLINPAFTNGEPLEESVEFLYNGAKYVLPPAVIRAVCEYRDKDELYANATRHLNNYIFDDDELDVSNLAHFDCLHAFLEEHQLGTAGVKELLPQIIQRYEAKFDCNVAENDQWESAIEAVLAEIC